MTTLRHRTVALGTWAGVVTLALLAAQARGGSRSPPQPVVTLTERRALEQAVEHVRGELTLARLQLERADAILGLATRYGVPAEVATDIYDLSLVEGIEPQLAFRLVKVESNFVANATSAAGAVGYTQILPSTARLYEPGLTLAQLYERRTNLRLGFRYLHDLLDRYDGGRGPQQVQLALLAYNRGPARVQELLDAGRDPQNGYPAAVMKDYGVRAGRRTP